MPLCYYDSSIPVIKLLLNTGMAFVLALSCLGSALAAAPCPHGCQASASALHSHAHLQQGNAKAAGHCHSEMNDGESRQTNEASGHESRDAGEYADAGSAAAEFSGFVGSAQSSCDHCMGRAELPSSSLTEREANQFKKGDEAAPLFVGTHLVHPAAGFIKEIIPYDDGPPSLVHRHVLIGVFRI